ncbi:MAG TPA: glycosyltransferase family 4 protein [Opitutaceae bacterium]|nr:glycosyltransferase family 4 protein [Opitutaceae bacterium]
MKISIVTGFFLPVPAIRGGATERSWHTLAKAFAAAGHSVAFISRSVPELPSDEIKDGMRHIRIRGFDHRKMLSLNLILDLLWGLKVAFFLPRGDVVICNTVSLPIWLRFFRPKCGKVAVMVGRIPKGQIDYYGDVSRIYVPSAYVGQLVAERGFERAVKVIGNPIDWSVLAAASGHRSQVLNIGFAGRLHPEKGIELLLKAAKRLSLRRDLAPWRLSIIGPSSVAEGGGGEEWVASMKEFAARELEQQVTWLPAEYDPAKLAAVYGTMDIFCYPSLADRGETFGISVAEAMAARCTLVVSSLPCFSDLIADGDTGLVFDHHAPDSEARLEDCLARLISDPALRTAMASRGQEWSRRFDFPVVAANILQDLSLLAGAGGQKRQ